MKTNSIRLFFLAAVAVTASLPLSAQFTAGTWTPKKAPSAADLANDHANFQSILTTALSPANVAQLQRLSAEMRAQAAAAPFITTFDNVTAPCGFGPSPLNGIHQDASFTGFNGGGGSILNECSNFGLNAYSQPNFLAFNKTAVYSGGGTASLPELMVFGAGKSSVSLWVSGGSAPGYEIALIALGSGGIQQAVSTILTGGWVQMTVSGSGLTSAALVGNPLYLVVDNIEAQ